jgi:hypothetical protein
VNRPLISITVVATLLLVGPQALAQCGTDKQCQRLYTCFVQDYAPNYRAEPYGANCLTGVTHCLVINPSSSTDYQWITCSEMQDRGAENSGPAGVFNPSRTLTDKNGQQIEFSDTTGKVLQLASGILALQQRGKPIDSDVNASLEAAGIPIVEGAEIEMTEDADTGERAFTVRGASIDEFVLRFDAKGVPIQDDPTLPAEVLENLDRRE